MMRGLGFVTVSLLIFTFRLTATASAGQRRDFSNEHDFIRHFLGDDFSLITAKNDDSKVDGNSETIQEERVDNSSRAEGKLSIKSGRIDIHEHDHKEKGRHYHKNRHNHSHKSTGRHIHRHEHHHNHKHNHQHDHDGEHDQKHQHSHKGDHAHIHRKKLVFNNDGWKKYSHEEDAGKNIKKHKDHRNPSSHPNSLTKDYHIKSVENYIGDSGKEFEGAAEQIVESYMGEYMQEYMQGWYGEYCAKTGQFCDQVILKHSTKDKKTGEEIVYNVDSSSGYMTQPPHAYYEKNQDDDIRQLYHTLSTTVAPTTTSEVQIVTTERNKEKNNKRQELVEKMRKMFHKLGQKYKKVKENSVTDPDELSQSSSTPASVEFTTVTSTENPRIFSTDKNVDPEFQLIEDDFDDFIPMEYEFVEDVIIENY